MAKYFLKKKFKKLIFCPLRCPLYRKYVKENGVRIFWKVSQLNRAQLIKVTLIGDNLKLIKRKKIVNNFTWFLK